MKSFKQQFLPIILTVVTFFGLIGILSLFIHFLNIFPLKEKIQLDFHFESILVGLTIYLKTSIDFALFIGNQMKQNPGWKNRIAIEIGTAVGNGLGTFLVLSIWTFFKEVPLFMILMITIAALVLFRMAEDGLGEYVIRREHQAVSDKNRTPLLHILHFTLHALEKINAPLSPLIKRMLPHSKTNAFHQRSFTTLLLFAASIPFLLGLDDFAGYIPLFSIVNVFSFSIGVLFGHMILNMLLFASPHTTITLVKQPVIMVFGSFAFIGIGVWGFYEVLQIVFHLFLT